MILGISVNVSFAEKNIDFVIEPLKRERKKILYHPTLKKISDHGATQLIIPYDINGCDYDYKKIIEHIRTDSNEAISKIPILVYFEDDEKYLEEMKESDGLKKTRFESIAVAFST